VKNYPSEGDFQARNSRTVGHTKTESVEFPLIRLFYYWFTLDGSLGVLAGVLVSGWWFRRVLIAVVIVIQISFVLGISLGGLENIHGIRTVILRCQFSTSALYWLHFGLCFGYLPSQFSVFVSQRVQQLCFRLKQRYYQPRQLVLKQLPATSKSALTAMSSPAPSPMLRLRSISALRMNTR
jgi:hypothetical protein